MGSGLGTLAQDRNILPGSQSLKQSQGKFLAVIFDERILPVEGSRFEKFGLVAARELGPGQFAGEKRAQ